MADQYWATIDDQVVAADDHKLSLTFSSGGVATDISGWTFQYLANSGGWTTDTISIADGTMTKTDSGSGTTDTINIIFSDTVTDVDPGKYRHSLVAQVPTDDRTIFRGTLRVHEKRAEVP